MEIGGEGNGEDRLEVVARRAERTSGGRGDRWRGKLQDGEEGIRKFSEGSGSPQHTELKEKKNTKGEDLVGCHMAR